MERLKGVEEVRTVGEMIRDARRRRGLTQRQLADMLGVTQSAISAIETSAIRPGLDLQERLAQVLGIPYEALEEALAGYRRKGIRAGKRVTATLSDSGGSGGVQ